MNRQQQAVPMRGTIFAALLAASVASPQAAEYSNTYFFGDSLTDSGTFGPILGVGRYDRFTTKPGTVWAENLGARYGKQVSPAYTAMPGAGGVLAFPINATGNNLAVGNARINTAPWNSASAANLPPVSAQVTGFLARGVVDSKALYALSAGGNDVFAQFVPNGGAVPAQANQTAISTAANDLVTQVARLQAAGARKLIVVGLMDTASAPFGLALSEADRAQLRSLKASFDSRLAAGLAGKNVLYFDTGKLISTVLANPAAYGFSNTTGQICGAGSALQCQVSANGYMYADDKHPTTLFHKLLSDWIYSSLEGGSRVALLSLVPLVHSDAQWRAVDARMQAFQNFGYQGQGVFVSGAYSSSRKDPYAGLPSAEGAGGGIVVGFEKAFNPALFGGVTLGYSDTPFDLGNNQGSVKYNAWAVSGFVSHKRESFYANALVDLALLKYQSTRNVVLGTFAGNEQGNTRGTQFGVKTQLGYNFHAGSLVHGPLAGLAWQRVRVNGFSENSDSVTAMVFGEQTRVSLRSRLGWQVAAEMRCLGADVRPYAQLAYDYEHQKDARTYLAGFVGGVSSMEMPIENQTGGYGTVQAGVAVEIAKNMRLGIDALTTIKQPGARNTALNITLGIPL